MTGVWNCQLPAAEKLVLLALADNANDEGNCWPSIATISRKTGKCARAVQAAISALETAGFLRRVHKIGIGCEYFLDPRRICTPAENAPPQKLTPTPAESAPKPSLTVKASVANATGSADPVKELFDAGVALLVASGLTEKNSRSLIGKWRKGKSDGDVLTGFIECKARAISAPVEWLEKRFKSARRVSPSGYEYRGSDADILREAERRADWGTYYEIKGEASAH